MSDDLARRVARRRRQLERQRQVRRRRTVLVFAALLLAAIPAFLIVGDGSDGPGQNSPLAPESKTVATAATPNSTWKPSKAPVPILMYHVIGDPAGDVALPGLFLSVDSFQEQVDWLEDNGYTAVTLVQVEDAWYDGGTLPKKPVVLSFDDGYLGQYTDAMPILSEKGWAGQLNLKAEGSDLSTWMVKRMMEAGWEIASHTINHLDLTTLSPAQLRKEVAGSRKKLEKELKVDIENFCYPAGQFSDRVVKAVEAAGYRGATTEISGLADRKRPFELDRIRINRDDGSDVISADLAAAGA